MYVYIYIYIYIYIYTYICINKFNIIQKIQLTYNIYIYIYIYIERERERDTYISVYIYIYIFIYTYVCCIPREKVTILIVYKNIHLSFLLKKVRNSWQGNRESQELLTFTPGWDTIYSESYFFALPPQGWHNADLKHLIIFVFFFTLSPWDWHRADLRHLIIFISSSLCLHEVGTGLT